MRGRQRAAWRRHLGAFRRALFRAARLVRPVKVPREYDVYCHAYRRQARKGLNAHRRYDLFVHRDGDWLHVSVGPHSVEKLSAGSLLRGERWEQEPVRWRAG